MAAASGAPALGVDFGTSNSAAACIGAGGAAQLLALEGEHRTLPSAIFFNAEDHGVAFGREAMAQYLAGTEGRLMRSLKSLLGSPLLQEQTALPHGSASFEDILTRFLAEVRQRAETRLGRPCPRAVIGRPVHFVDGSAARDARAQEDLHRAAARAGFTEVGFELEPIAASFDYERRVERECLVLVADIGGGTSDFSVVRLGPDRMHRADRSGDVLATSGIHIGGTDYDRRISLEEVMPHLGRGHLGPQGREVPSRVFFDLASWHLINIVQAPKAVREAQQLRADYSDAALHDRLMTVLRERLGHQLAAEVEDAKIRVSNGGMAAAIPLASVEAGLGLALEPGALQAHLAALLQQVVDCARECVRRAGIAPGTLGAVYLTGGSAALKAFQRGVAAAFSGVPLVEGDLFGGVAAGLGYAAKRRFGG
jgi:hypothetical chaperone protein